MILGLNEVMFDALLKACPSEESRAAVRKQYAEITREYATRLLPVRLEAQQKFLVCTIADGVLYGNWPWVKVGA